VDLGEGEEGVRRGDDPSGVRRHLRSRADAGALRGNGDLGRDAVDHPPGRPGQPDQVGRDQVAGSAELVQVSAAAEGLARPAQFDGLDGLVGLGDEQDVEQRLPQVRAERVTPGGVVEHDREPPAVPARQHRLRRRLAVARCAALAEPARELRSAEQQRVYGGLGCQAAGGIQSGRLPQQLSAGDRGPR